jgi:hypothetical protein
MAVRLYVRLYDLRHGQRVRSRPSRTSPRDANPPRPASARYSPPPATPRCGRLFGTLGSGLLYTYVGEDAGPLAGTDGLRGLSVCFIAGTVSSLIAAAITIKIKDNQAGLRCGPIVCVRPQVVLLRNPPAT